MADLVGQTLAGRFRVVKLLGSGAMGEVYEAAHATLGRRYAIKVLHDEIEDDERLVERFRREAHAASRLDHPHIVSIIDFGRTEPTERLGSRGSGRLFLVMEHIDGSSLAEVIDTAAPRRLPQQRSVLILSQICSAVQAAHDAGVVHRDLKPENVLVGKGPAGQDHVKILDFGLAKMMQDPALSQLTKKGEIFGTPAYMSPEQALGSNIDHRADVYSIGVMAYELFSGRLPFVYNSIPKLLIAHQTELPAPPSRHLRPGEPPIPRDIEDTILRCLAKDPAQRLQKVADLHAILGTYLKRISVVGSRVVPNVVLQSARRGQDDSEWCEVTYDTGSTGIRGTLLGDDLLEEISEADEAALLAQIPARLQDEAGAAPPVGATRDWFWSQVVKKAHTLASSLREQGLGTDDLNGTLFNLAHLGEKILSLETEVAVARSRIDELESMTREAESRLRFAVMDLSMERGRLLDDRRAPAHILLDLDFQIQTLEQRLSEVYSQRASKIDAFLKSIEAREQHLSIYQQRQVDTESWLLNLLHRLRPNPCPEDLNQLYLRIEELLRAMQRAS